MISSGTDRKRTSTAANTFALANTKNCADKNFSLLFGGSYSCFPSSFSLLLPLHPKADCGFGFLTFVQIGDWPSPTRSPTPSTSSVPTRRRSSVAENPKPPSSRVVSEAPSLLPLRREAIPAQVVTIGAQANGIVATTAPTPKHRTPKRNERHSLDAPTVR